MKGAISCTKLTEFPKGNVWTGAILSNLYYIHVWLRLIMIVEANIVKWENLKTFKEGTLTKVISKDAVLSNTIML